jgi:hypothetical protein
MEHNMRMAGTPKANVKQLSSPRQRTSRKIGVTDVEMNEPELMEK